MTMDGELRLNIALPSGDFRESKEKKTPKQRKVEFELRRGNKHKKRFENKGKNRKAAIKSSNREKRPKQEKDGFATSIFRGETMPTTNSNEGRLIFPQFALKISDDGRKRKNNTENAKSKYNSNANAKELAVPTNTELTKKTTCLEDDKKASKSAIVWFVKKPKEFNDHFSRTTGKFLRKSKKASDVKNEDFQFAFGDSSEKANVAEDSHDFSGASVFHGCVDNLKMKFHGDTDSGKISQLKKRRKVNVDSSPKASKRRRGDSDCGATSEEEQRRVKKTKKSGSKDSVGGEDDEGNVWRGKFTSLFGNNPEIPAVPRRAVRPVLEPIFSDEQFSELPVHKFLVSNLTALGLTQMTTVQRKAVPVLLDGRDALVRSQTGSGKTLAYALPLVELLQRQQPPLTRADGVRALIVLPTRELALQTYECFLKLVKPFMRLVPGCLVGGEKRKSEKARLRKGITILVGTPGRLLDHVQNTRNLRLDRVQYLVLDEADLLLDMGYERDIASIVEELDTQSQPLLSKEVLDWNRKTYVLEKESLNKTSIKKEKHIKVGCTSRDSGAGEEETSDEESKKTRKMKENVMKAVKAKSLREEDETSDYDPEERADEVVDAKVLEDDKWDEESTDEADVYTKKDDVWEAEDEGVGKGGALSGSQERRRQTVLLSATLTPAVERLAGLALHSPDFVDAAEVEMDTKDVVIPDSLIQCYMVVPAKLRLVTLSAFILWKCKFCNERKMLLFCATQDMVDYLTELLTMGLSLRDTDHQEDSEEEEDSEEKFNVGVDFFRLHGHMDQKERTLVFQTFRAADCGVLLCTDVAARGLDLPRVNWIVQFTAPGSVPDYVHRVGRTARVGAAGSALLFLLPAEADFVQLLQDRRIRLQEEKMDSCLKKLNQAISSSELSQGSSIEAAATALQLRYENAVLNQRSLRDLAVKAYVSFVRFYASYPKEVRDVFCFKALHLGHQAKSFALRDPPRAIAGIGRRRFQEKQQQSGARAPAGKQREGGPSRARPRSRPGEGQAPAEGSAGPKVFQIHQRRRMRDLVLSEFESGLETIKKRKTRDYT